MLKTEKRKSQFKYELGRLMGEYAVPLPMRNFNLSNKETRRLELWNNQYQDGLTILSIWKKVKRRITNWRSVGGQ